MLPGTTNKFACGGLWAELKTLELVKKVCPAEVVTYRQREKGHLWLDDLLKGDDTFRALDDVIFVMSWGFDVAKLAPKLKRLNAIEAIIGNFITRKIPPWTGDSKITRLRKFAENCSQLNINKGIKKSQPATRIENNNILIASVKKKTSIDVTNPSSIEINHSIGL